MHDQFDIIRITRHDDDGVHLASNLCRLDREWNIRAFMTSLDGAVIKTVQAFFQLAGYLFAFPKVDQAIQSAIAKKSGYKGKDENM